MIVLLALVVTACAPGSDNFAAANQQANLIHGVWHGWIAPFTLIWQIFNSDVRVYEPNNVGWWYDFGFYVAIVGGFGSFALSRNRAKKTKPDEATS